MFKTLRYLVVVVLSTTLGLTAAGQGVTTAGLSGVVSDNSGAPLVGATVKATHVPSGTIYGSITNASGRYTIQGMRVGGPYEIQLSYVGFQVATYSDITLQLGVTQVLDGSLVEEGVSIDEVVIEGAQDEILNGSRTGAATNVSSTQIANLPTINRAITDFTRLNPQANGLNIGGRSSNFNNITLDGAVFNNSFGLSSTIGGQANIQPVPIDAIDQIQVNIAPYDVTQGSFTGAGINAVTRSGDNEYRASVYGYYRDQSLSGTKTDGQTVTPLANDNTILGVRLGGPIIKNKLFLFLNYERERRSTAASLRVANRPGLPAPGPGSNTVNVNATDLDQFIAVVGRKFNGYDPGPYEGYDYENEGDRLSVRLDWNIAENHRLSARFNFLNSFGDNPVSLSGNNATGALTQVNFLSSSYRINNDMINFVVELNSTFGTRFANTFQVGFTALRDKREPIGDARPFPNVSISNFATFGFEPFSANNELDTDVFQISDNFTAYLGDHTITVGTYNEFYGFRNGFAPRYYGAWSFSSLTQFYNSIGVSSADPTNASLDFTPTTGQYSSYQQTYLANPSEGFPFVEIDAIQLGFYAQDKWNVRKGLDITLGLRVDIPWVTTELDPNPIVEAITFAEGKTVDVSQYPGAQILLSPRLGFNWDVKGDRSIQVRGGTGYFVGRVPFVWLSNQASNNGLLFGNFTAPAGGNFNFLTAGNDVFNYVNGLSGAASTFNIAVTDDDFKYPAVWRSNLGVDVKLPFGIVGTVDGAFSDDINAIYHRNINLDAARGNLVSVGGNGDTRPVWGFPTNPIDPSQSGSTSTAGLTTDNQISTTINATDGAILMSNTNEGYSWFVTGALTKNWKINEKSQLFATTAYTYTDSRSVNDGGSIAASIYRDRPTSGDPNANVSSFFGSLQRERIISSAIYQVDYAENFGTVIGFFFEAAPGRRFSTVYNGTITNKGNSNNELIYIPRDQSEIILQDQTFLSGANTRVYTAAQQWADLNAYIESDPYLRENRGKYAERNGSVLPWEYGLDMHIGQNLYLKVGEKTHTLQLTLDIFNVFNLLNDEWGQRYTNLRGFQSGNTIRLIDARGINAAGQPVYRYLPLVNPFVRPDGTVQELVPLRSYTNTDVNTPSARWSMQFGIRYIFNDVR